jgi:hypothetical protein
MLVKKFPAFCGTQRFSTVFTGKVKGLLGRYRSGWDKNTRIDREIGLEGVNWIYLAQDKNQW